jgi:hypothetical protein
VKSAQIHREKPALRARGLTNNPHIGGIRGSGNPSHAVARRNALRNGPPHELARGPWLKILATPVQNTRVKTLRLTKRPTAQTVLPRDWPPRCKTPCRSCGLGSLHSLLVVPNWHDEHDCHHRVFSCQLFFLTMQKYFFCGLWLGGVFQRIGPRGWRFVDRYLVRRRTTKAALAGMNARCFLEGSSTGGEPFPRSRPKRGQNTRPRQRD